MKEFSLDEFLRYIVVGSFFIFINILAIDKVFLNKIITIVEKQNVISILIGLTILFGVLIYSIYRAFIFQVLINPLVVKCCKKSLGMATSDSVYDYMYEKDIKRINLDKPALKKYLSEWASQIHILYNFSLSLVYLFILKFFYPAYFEVNYFFLFIALLLFLIGLYYHVKYKIFEQKCCI